MSKTLQAIRNDVRLLISQEDSANTDFTDSQLNGFINQGVKYIGTLIEYPRDIADIQVEDGKPSYTLPTDYIKMIGASFGSRDINGDCITIPIITMARLKEVAPNWLDNTDSSKGRPAAAVLLDRYTIMLYPRPNADESATGKKLYMEYNYTPAVLTADGDIPDLPDLYQDFVSHYAVHLCYMGKLNNPALAKGFLDGIATKIKSVQPQITNEVQDMRFEFGNDGDDAYDSNTNYNRLALGRLS
jgi:hypothetical protein